MPHRVTADSVTTDDVTQLHEAIAKYMEKCAKGCTGFVELAAQFRRTSPLLSPPATRTVGTSSSSTKAAPALKQQQPMSPLDILSTACDEKLQEVKGDSAATAAGGQKNSQESVNLESFVAIAKKDSLVDMWKNFRSKPVSCRHPGCSETFVNFANRRRHELKLHQADYSNGKGSINVNAEKSTAKSRVAGKSRSRAALDDSKGKGDSKVVESKKEPRRKKARTVTPSPKVAESITGEPHVHGPNCGHVAVLHNGHADFLLETGELDHFHPPSQHYHKGKDHHHHHHHHHHRGHLNNQHSHETGGGDRDRCPVRAGSSMHVLGLDDPILNPAGMSAQVQPVPDRSHVHGPDCGHQLVLHGDHYDYLVDGWLYHTRENGTSEVHGQLDVIDFDHALEPLEPWESFFDCPDSDDVPDADAVGEQLIEQITST